MTSYFGELQAHGRQQRAGAYLPPERAIADWTEIWGPRLGGSWAYQDAARSTLATQAGDRVGSVTGHLAGIHLEQATAGQRFTLAAGLQGLMALDADAVDDYMRSQISGDLATKDGGWLVYVVFASVGASGRVIAATDSDTVGNDYDMQNGMNIYTSAGQLVHERLVPAAPCVLAGYPSGAAYAAVAIDDDGGSRTLYGVNGASDTESAAAGGGLAPDRLFVNAGVSGGITFFGAHKIQEIGVLARLPTAAEIANTIGWIRSTWGAS